MDNKRFSVAILLTKPEIKWAKNKYIYETDVWLILGLAVRVFCKGFGQRYDFYVTNKTTYWQMYEGSVPINERKYKKDQFKLVK